MFGYDSGEISQLSSFSADFKCGTLNMRMRPSPLSIRYPSEGYGILKQTLGFFVITFGVQNVAKSA